MSKYLSMRKKNHTKQNLSSLALFVAPWESAGFMYASTVASLILSWPKGKLSKKMIMATAAPVLTYMDMDKLWVGRVVTLVGNEFLLWLGVTENYLIYLKYAICVNVCTTLSCTVDGIIAVQQLWLKWDSNGICYTPAGPVNIDLNYTSAVLRFSANKLMIWEMP